MIVTDLVVEVQRNKFFTSCSLDDLEVWLTIRVTSLQPKKNNLQQKA